MTEEVSHQLQAGTHLHHITFHPGHQHNILLQYGQNILLQNGPLGPHHNIQLQYGINIQLQYGPPLKDHLQHIQSHLGKDLLTNLDMADGDFQPLHHHTIPLHKIGRMLLHNHYSNPPSGKPSNIPAMFHGAYLQPYGMRLLQHGALHIHGQLPILHHLAHGVIDLSLLR